MFSKLLVRRRGLEEWETKTPRALSIKVQADEKPCFDFRTYQDHDARSVLPRAVKLFHVKSRPARLAEFFPGSIGFHFQKSHRGPRVETFSLTLGSTDNRVVSLEEHF